MNTLDQVKLLEQKVMSAVEKIKQLQAENDALRNKCAELTNAISSKSEQLEAFENNKNLIESGIQNALDRLNSIEYSILDKADDTLPTPKPETEPEAIKTSEPINTTNNPSFDNLAAVAFGTDYTSGSNEEPEEETTEEESVERETETIEESSENFGFNPIYNPVEETTETEEPETESEPSEEVQQNNIDLEKKIENSFQTVSFGNTSFTNYLGGDYNPEPVEEEKESPFLNPFDNFDSMSPVENTFAHDAFAPENNPFENTDDDEPLTGKKPDIW